MKAVQVGSQVLGLPSGLPSSDFFSAMGVDGAGVVCGWSCCGVVPAGCGVERLQAASVRIMQIVRGRIRGIVRPFVVQGPE
jgi:hypothetical protein